jgi:glutamate-5-semialdehyde dehydrogenase
MTASRLETLAPGMPIPYGGDKLAHVSPELAAAFRPGDRLIVVQETGDLLHVPAAAAAVAATAVARADDAFRRMAAVSDSQISGFFEAFAAGLASEQAWTQIARANADDVAGAKARGRSTTRLALSERMRGEMIAGLGEWRDAAGARGRVLARVDHPGWSLEQVAAPLGVVGFVFEGRPNVFADAAGVLRTGNTVVFRIGSDALATARAITACALEPALAEAGLPEGAASLIESADHAAGWAMFADDRLALAVARGSGPAVAQLGAVARQAGTPVSLHGTGGAWIVADRSADAARFAAAVYHSLDRKVCNTLNVCCIVRERAADLVPLFLDALRRAGERRAGCKLHVIEGGEGWLPKAWLEGSGPVVRADGAHQEKLVEIAPVAELAREWEWEETPEVSLAVVESVDQAVALFNRLSPRFAASLIAEDDLAHKRFFEAIDAPFVGDGFTRWIDGQYALNQPELGLSNWRNGRLLARSGILSGADIFTVRGRARQTDLDLDRQAESPKTRDAAASNPAIEGHVVRGSGQTRA